MNIRSNPVRHDGEFVLTIDGSRDFGEIKAETGLKEGKIRLRTGIQANERGNYGEKHIEIGRNFPTADVLERLAAALGIETHELFAVTAKQPHTPRPV